MLVFMTSVNVASIAAMAISQGLWLGRQLSAGETSNRGEAAPNR
jgi:hypothetical protein